MNAFAHINPQDLFDTTARLRRAHHGRLRRTRRAFTLIEIIVVVTIIAILAAAIAPRLLGRLQWAKENKAASEVRAIASAVEMFILDGQRYPTLLMAAETGHDHRREDRQHRNHHDHFDQCESVPSCSQCTVHVVSL